MSDEKMIREMAELSLFTNKINEIQEKNLKMFPFVFFNGVSKAVVRYDFSNNNGVEYEEDKKNLEIKYHFKRPTTQNFKVIYELEIEEKADNSYLEKRFEAIETSVRNLFWKDTKVIVYFGTKLVYGGGNERKSDPSGK